MNKIDEMIRELCPEGVKRVKLGEVAEIIRGNRVTKKQLLPEGLYPVISGGVTPMGFLNEYNREENVITIAQYGTAGYVDFQKTKFWANDVCYSLFPSETIKNQYLFYVLKWKQDYLYSIRNTDATPFSLPIDYLRNVEIPLPPLAIQQEIVSILDSFSSLQSKLEEELAVRQKQMEFYREKLLTFDKDDNSVKWMKLGEVGTIVRGNGLQKKDFVESGIGCIHYGQIYTRFGLFADKTLTYVDETLADKLTQVYTGDVVMACTSENVEDVCKSVVWLGKERIVTGGHSAVFKHNQNPKYIGYCFTTNSFQEQKRKYAYGTKVIDIKMDKLAVISVPIPPLSRQQEIVSTLDTMSSLIDKLKEEIELRKKQYEYYREALLSF